MLISNHLGKNLVEIDLKALATQYGILIINQTLGLGTNGIRGMATGQNYQLKFIIFTGKSPVRISRINMQPVH